MLLARGAARQEAAPHPPATHDSMSSIRHETHPPKRGQLGNAPRAIRLRILARARSSGQLLMRNSASFCPRTRSRSADKSQSSARCLMYAANAASNAAFLEPSRIMSDAVIRKAIARGVAENIFAYTTGTPTL